MPLAMTNSLKTLLSEMHKNNDLKDLGEPSQFSKLRNRYPSAGPHSPSSPDLDVQAFPVYDRDKIFPMQISSMGPSFIQRLASKLGEPHTTAAEHRKSVSTRE